MSPKLASTLSYLFVPAIVFLLVEPYKSDKTVRGHALHSLCISAAWFVCSIALSIVLTVLAFIPGVQMIVAPVWMLLGPAISLGALALMAMLMLKAWNDDMLRLPYVTDMAMRFARK